MKKKETEFLTEEKAQAILRVPDRRTLQGQRDYAILLTLLTTGLRKAEICNLKVGDIKTYRNQAVVDVIGKGKKFRRIPMKNETLLAIKDYLKVNGNGVDLKDGVFYLPSTKTLKDPNGVGQKVIMQGELIDLFKNLPRKSEWVFYRANGEPFSRDHIYKQFKKILKAVGIDPKRFSWKELRHTTGSLMHRKGVPALAIKDQLRHSDIRTTVDFYIGSDLEYQREQNEKLSNEHFREFFVGLKENSEKTVKKVVDIDALQEVSPIASA